MILNNIRIAKNVTTTTSIFAEEIAKYNKNVYVLPNAIDPNEKQYTPTPEKSDRLRIGWLGGSSHLKDLEILKGVVGRLHNDGLLDKVQFVLCGYDLRGTMTIIDEQTGQQTQRPIKPMESVWYHYERIFTEDYTTVSPEYREFLLKFKNEEYPNVANEPYRRVWTKPISSYASNYNLFDISLAPIEENIFNKVKSQLKVIEAGFHKKALIAQDFGPYQIDVKSAHQFGGGWDANGNGILIETNKNHKDWYKFIKKLILEPELVQQLSENLHNTVKNLYSVGAVSDSRRDLYKKLKSQMDEKQSAKKMVLN
jgi:glycosyltransferase involved in cell wall biosynthesis